MLESKSTETAIEKRKISKAEINELPLISWDGRIEILTTEDEMNEAVVELLRETHLGFDTETRPCFRKGEYYPPALIQLATANCVYLFRICLIETLKPLLPILESCRRIKTGVGIKEDVRELNKMESFTPDGFVEISNLTTQLGYENKGLRALAGLLMNGRISKAAQVTNWARQELDSKQIRYAATDAWISRELYTCAQAQEKAS